MQIEQLVTAESGWKAVFKEPDGGESVSRILGWAVVDGELVGVIVDPTEPSRVVPAGGASSPGGGAFLRYRYVAPEPIVVQAPTPAPTKEEETEEHDPTKLAKSFIKRRL